MAWRIWGRVIFPRLTRAPGEAHTSASWTVGASGSERARRARGRPQPRLETRARTGARTAPGKASSKSRTPCRTGTTVGGFAGLGPLAVCGSLVAASPPGRSLGVVLQQGGSAVSDFD